MKSGIKVMDAMTKKPVWVDPKKTVRECTKLMLDKHVGSLLVEEGKQVMTAKIVTITPEKDIYDAIVLMNKENLRRLPVVLNGRIIGLITLRDILTLQPTLFELIMDRIIVR